MADTGLGFGGNDWLVEDLYERYLDAPGSLSDAWRRYFEGNGEVAPPTDDGAPAAPPPSPVPTDTAGRTAPPDRPPTVESSPGPAPSPASPPPAVEPPEGAEILRGAAATIADRMEASRELPTATSVRSFPAKLLEVNRTIINNQLRRLAEGGKISFTHLIGWAVVRALSEQPQMNAAYAEVEGKPARVSYPHINLGLAMDLPRKDGGRTLLVPNLKRVDEMDFRRYWEAYEEVVRRVRSGSMTPDDFAGTTATLTNPGTVGTVQSVPRLMPEQGLIVGVGRIGFPPEYEGADPESLARAGLGRTLTMTSTYDHRIIQGAESGMFLARVHQLLLGADGFYEDVFASMAIPYVPVKWAVDSNPAPGSQGWAEKQARIFQLINMYRVRGHLIADLDPLRQKPPQIHDELDPITYGLSLWDLDREFATGGLAGRTRMTLGRDPRRAARRVLPNVGYRVHAHPGARPEAVDPGARRATGAADQQRREAPAARQADRGGRLRAVPPHQVPRRQALQPGGRRDPHPAARRGAQHRLRRRDGRGRSRHGHTGDG